MDSAEKNEARKARKRERERAIRRKSFKSHKKKPAPDDDVDPERGAEAGLTPRQALFAERYARHGNGTKAAQEAGYSPKNCTHYAWELLHSPVYEKVRQYSLMRRREILDDMGFTPETMLRELVKIAMDIPELKEDTNERLGTVRNKLKALSDLERLLNWFNTNVTKTENKHDLTGSVGILAGGIGRDELLEIKSKISGLSKDEILEYERKTSELMG